MANAPQLLRVPEKLHTVEDVLNCAGKMDLPNVFVLAERRDGKLVFLTTSDMSGASINWILDRAKRLVLEPEAFERIGHGTA